jgi:hypothetical protein
MRTRSLVVAAAVSSLVFSGSPASATTKSFHDPVGDTNNHGLMDIGTATVTNTSKIVKVTVRIPKATTTYPQGSGTIYLDTDPSKRGPELVWGFGIPGDSSTSAMKNWKYVDNKKWSLDPSTTKCGKTTRERIDLEAGVFSFAVKTKKGCLGKPKKVRAYVVTTVTGEFPSDSNYDEMIDYDSRESDYYPAKKTFSPWVRR